MKKITKIAAAAFSVIALTSCGGPELLSIMPAYMGEDVTSTYHEFTKDDFYVIASYENGVDKVVTDFEFEVEGMDAGYYIINITYEDVDNPVYVPINVNIYPSDFAESSDGANEEHDHE